MNWASINTVFYDYIQSILGKYKQYLELDLTTPIGFDGVTASQRLTVFTPNVDSDALLFGANVDFSNSSVTVKITDVASGYVWTLSTTGLFTPIVAIAGVTTQNTPVLPLVCPFFLSRQSKLQMDFVNSAAALTTGGNITWRGIKLLN